MEQVHLGDAVTVGLAQVLALVPGTSRSGITIMAGLFRGLSREAAARFSFLLSLPAVFAAAVHQLYHERAAAGLKRRMAVNLLVATVVAGVVGYLSIALLLTYVRQHATTVFVVYRLLLAGLLIALLSTGRLEPLRGLSLEAKAKGGRHSASDQPSRDERGSTKEDSAQLRDFQYFSCQSRYCSLFTSLRPSNLVVILRNLRG